MPRPPSEPPLPPDPVIEAYKKDIDRTLISESLKLTPQQRLERLMELQRFGEELQRAGRELRNDTLSRIPLSHGEVPGVCILCGQPLADARGS